MDVTNFVREGEVLFVFLSGMQLKVLYLAHTMQSCLLSSCRNSGTDCTRITQKFEIKYHWHKKIYFAIDIFSAVCQPESSCSSYVFHDLIEF
jgi:hypothetical protein